MPTITRQSATELLAGLPPASQALLQTVTTLAAARGWSVAIVGGSVRDLALGVPLDRDLDIVVQGDAPALAETLAHACGGRVVASHAAFGTATVLVPEATTRHDRAVDLAGARTETYTHPGALPTVTPATLDADLARRDFTLNALAVELDAAGSAPVLRDPYDGMADLAAGRLRILHAQSFADDPTRILRGLRLAARLGLHFEPATHAALVAALADNALEHTSPDRIRNELCLALDEPQPEAVLELGDTLGITPHVLPTLRFTPALRDRMERARNVTQLPAGVPSTDLALGMLTYDFTLADREALIGRYRLASDAARLLREVASIQQLCDALSDPLVVNSQFDRLLQPFTLGALTVVRLAEGPAVAAAITHYLNDIRSVAPLLTGRDLIALGVRPGPQLGILLSALRSAFLDGVVTTRDEGLAWVRARVDETRR